MNFLSSVLNYQSQMIPKVKTYDNKVEHLVNNKNERNTSTLTESGRGYNSQLNHYN